jgi:hypothetical protein
LSLHPGLVRAPGPVQRVSSEEAVWVERPDAFCCYCCNGTGLVSDAVMRRFINPEYDPTMSPPIRCLRTMTCGSEEALKSDKDVHVSMRRRRYEHRTELPDLPRDIADQIHQRLKAEARELALSPNRAERLAAVKAQVRADIARWSQRTTMPEAPADE